MELLTDFLLARIAEDEVAARAASPGSWRADGNEVRNADEGTLVVRWAWPQEGAHIARWDPARVLAECEAKRRIIRWVQTWPWRKEPPSSVDGLLPMLALPYADHPDYREEWQPAMAAAR